MAGKLFIISAPSGAGKTTLVEYMLKQLKDQHRVFRVLTYTTRVPRETEEHGKDFYYISQAEFEHKVTQDFFIEWSNVYGCYYGTPRTVLDEIARGASGILIADRAGAKQVKAQVSESVPIWIYTSSIEVLQQRLLQRGTNTPEQIAMRLVLARDEIQQEDAHPVYQYHILNDDFYEACSRLYEIIMHFF